MTRLGEVYNALGRPECARACFEKVSGIDPANSRAANNQGVVCFKAGEYERAEWSVLRDLELDSENRAAHDNLKQLATSAQANSAFPRYRGDRLPDGESRFDRLFNAIGAMVSKRSNRIFSVTRAHRSAGATHQCQARSLFRAERDRAAGTQPQPYPEAELLPPNAQRRPEDQDHHLVP